MGAGEWQKKVYICVVVCEMACVKTVCLKSSDFTGADCQLELPSEDLYGILFVLSVISIVFACGVVVWDWFFHRYSNREYDQYADGVFPQVSPFFSIVFLILFLVHLYLDLRLRSDFDVCDEFSGVGDNLMLSILALIVTSVGAIGSCFVYEQPLELYAAFSSAGCVACCDV